MRRSSSGTVSRKPNWTWSLRIFSSGEHQNAIWGRFPQNIASVRKVVKTSPDVSLTVGKTPFEKFEEIGTRFLWKSTQTGMTEKSRTVQQSSVDMPRGSTQSGLREYKSLHCRPCCGSCHRSQNRPLRPQIYTLEHGLLLLTCALPFVSRNST